MIRVDLQYVFQLAVYLEPLGSLPSADVTYGDVFIPLVEGERALSVLVASAVYSPYLRSSSPLGQEVLNFIKALTDKHDLNKQVTGVELWRIRDSYSRYKIALMAEFATLESFFVTQKGAFDTVTLVRFGEMLFPLELGKKVPEAMYDAREAAKCLAYEVPTASGFHIFRVVESVLRRYYSVSTGGAAAPKVRTIAVYVNALRIAKVGDEKILAALKQLADFYRNPLVHPETVLVIEEAVGIYGLARTAVAAMLAVLPDAPVTTTSA